MIWKRRKGHLRLAFGDWVRTRQLGSNHHSQKEQTGHSSLLCNQKPSLCPPAFLNGIAKVHNHQLADFKSGDGRKQVWIVAGHHDVLSVKRENKSR